jgi:hypothetical protein
VAVTHLTPRKGVLGSATTYVGDIERAARGRKWIIEAITNGYATEDRTPTEDEMDYGMYLYLEDVLSMPYVWIYRTYNSGSYIAGGPIVRAAKHAYTSSSTPSFWNAKAATSDGYPYAPAGILPLAVECLEGLAPQAASSGTSELTFTLTALYALS